MIGKGEIVVGGDADLILVDMENQQEVKDENSWSRVGWNPFNGKSLTGWTKMTIVAGIPVFERTKETGPKGQLLVEPGNVSSQSLWVRGNKLVFCPFWPYFRYTYTVNLELQFRDNI